jgi:hypothetical protein
MFHLKPETRPLRAPQRYPAEVFTGLKRTVFVSVLVVFTMVAGLITSVPQMALANGTTIYSASGTITVDISNSTTVGLATGTVAGNATLKVSDLVAALKAGNVSIDAEKITFGTGALVNLSTDSPPAESTLTMKAAGDIKFSAGSGLIGGDHPLNLVFWADNAPTPVGGSIWFDGGTGSSKVDIQTKGGHLWMGGGSGSASWNGLTVGNSSAVGSRGNTNGIHLVNSTIHTAGGNIAIDGKGESGDGSPTPGSNKNGIRTFGVTTVDSGSGAIYMKGTTDATGNFPNNGVELSETILGTTYIRSSNATDQAIMIEGKTTGAPGTGASRRWGFFTWNTAIENTGGGTIHITGGGSQHSGVTISSGGAVLSSNGTIILEGTEAGAVSPHAVLIQGALGQKSGTSVTSSSANLEIIGNTFSATGTVASTGTLDIRPRTSDTTIGLGGAAGTLQISATNFDSTFADGFSTITVGSSAQTGTISSNAITLRDNTTLIGKDFSLGTIGASSNTVTLEASGNVTQSGALTAGSLALLGGGTFTLTNTSNAIGTVAAGSSGSKVAALSLYDASGGLTIGQVGSLEGVTATGDVLIETGAGDITLAKNIATDSSSNTAITVNAGKSTAAGTGTGGDIIVSGSPTLTTGANGIVRMFSGSEAASLGLTALVGGSSNVYYGVDETSTLSPALSSGTKYALFRSSVSVPQPQLSSQSNLSGVVGGSETLTPPSATDQSNDPVAGTTTWSSSNSSVASVSGSTLTYGVAGTAVITVTFTPADTSSFSVVTTSFTVTVSSAPSGDSSGGAPSGGSSGGASSGSSVAPTPVVPAPTVTPRLTRLAFGPPDTSPVRQPVERLGLLFNPNAPLRGTIGGAAVNISKTTVGSDGVSVIAGAFQFGVSLRGVPGAEVKTDTPSTSPELFVPRGGSGAVSGSGSYPGSFVQLWLPNGSSSREIARIPVRSDGTFTSDVIFEAGALELPVPIGRQVLQVVGYDEQGNQTVVDMTINIGQGVPAPEPNRQVGALPALTAGQSLATSGGIPEMVSITGVPETGIVVVEGSGWAVSVNADPKTGVVKDTGGTVRVHLDQSSIRTTSGSGFLPGTLATVWFFSEPTLVATVSVDDKGEFSAEFLVDARLIAPGEHTLQIQGVGTDGYIKAANLGVLVEQAVELTTESASGLLWWVAGVFLLVAALVVLLVVARRRRT